MIRKIVQIDEEKCNGCGACAKACHESAIEIVDGKAKLIRDDYCDGMGDCLPKCPMDAISFIEREALAYDEAAVKENQRKAETFKAKTPKAENTFADLHGAGGCPGSAMRQINRNENISFAEKLPKMESCLTNWPVQIKLAPFKAPYFEGEKLLIAADCTAYAYASFHQDFMKGRVALIGCPKLDGIDYSEKLAKIIADNNIESIDLIRMEVPCCGGLEFAAKKAIAASGKTLPINVVTISIDGKIL